MMTNLFESFDPMNSLTMSLNYISMFMFLIMMPYMYWLIPSRFIMLWNILINKLYTEYKLVTFNKYQSNILVFLGLVTFIMMLNFMSLIPYVYSMTSQISLNMSMSLTLWFCFFIYSLFKNFKNFLIHLVPLNTPLMLINFMVLIELISIFIRPLTLAIRLTANLIAGHLLLILLGTFIANFPTMIPIIIIIQNLLLMLELAMSFIQAYVFSMLTIMYFSESK